MKKPRNSESRPFSLTYSRGEVAADEENAGLRIMG